MIARFGECFWFKTNGLEGLATIIICHKVINIPGVSEAKNPYILSYVAVTDIDIFDTGPVSI
jgi:hypothetical protein